MALVQKTVGKIGIGTEEDPIRPDTDVKSWAIVQYLGDKFVIEFKGEDANGEI